MSNSKQVLFIYAIGKENLIFKAGPTGSLQPAFVGTPLNPHLLPYTLKGIMKQPKRYILELNLETAMLGDISPIVLEKYT